MSRMRALRPEGGISLGAGGLIVLAFFLPMFRGCGRFDVTGFQAATKAPTLYAPLLVGLLALLAGLVLLRFAKRWVPLVTGAAALLVLVQLLVQSIRYALDPDFRGVKPLVGFWVLFGGLLALIAYAATRLPRVALPRLGRRRHEPLPEEPRVGGVHHAVGGPGATGAEAVAVREQDQA